MASTPSPHPGPRSPGPRNSARSRNGCWTCRAKKVKCDERRPQCQRCTRLTLLCDYAPRMRRNSAKLAGLRAMVQKLSQAAVNHLPSSLPVPLNSACSINLSSADHEAIRYFRTTFARVHHTKNPSFSLYAITFSLAEREPMVMHAVLALGGRDLEFRRRGGDQESGKRTLLSLNHYSAALRLLSQAVGGAKARGGRRVDLDTILSAQHLMLLYEQKYGDAKGSGLANHLAGAAQVVRHCCRDISLQRVTSMPGEKSKHVALIRQCQPQGEAEPQVLSLFSARLLAHMGGLDVMASSFGLGGQLIVALKEVSGDHFAARSYDDGLHSLHEFSYSLYRLVWAESYPQAELLDDLENRGIFELALAAAYLRFKVSRLHSATLQEVDEVAAAIERVGFRFSELLGVAEELSIATDNSHRLVANIRAVVPQFYAVQIEFLRMVRTLGIRGHQQSPEHLIRAIMSLALQACKHQGDEAMIRIAWPLYIIAMETDDPAHKRWILARFQAISLYGENYERAYQFLERATSKTEAPVFRETDLDSGDVELFVL